MDLCTLLSVSDQRHIHSNLAVSIRGDFVDQANAKLGSKSREEDLSDVILEVFRPSYV